ncbi:biotin/lipoyl-binding protein [Halorhodospira neutriphila]|uniref:Multidrug resistance protein MdtA-like barrel-sandwich hybrid domain-containing protein n=1 Tax=Halorhodospira neutriphila TaxID=168379 RepID=A0ABS1E6B9_9GAMM|nr:hypothetical protein [Halorhodospira neutriphila]
MANGAKRRKGLQLALSIGVLAAGAGVFTLLAVTQPAPPAGQATEPSWVVTTERAEPGLHTPLVRLYGHVESPSAATLRAAVEADVEAVPARDGQLVDRGELLVRLDDAELRDVLAQRQAELDELEAALAQERRAVEADREDLAAEQSLLEIERRRVSRLERLLADDAASPSQLDDAREERVRQRQAVIQAQERVDTAEQRLAIAEARRDAAEAARDQARRDVQRSEVRAPVSGRISGVEVGPGDRVRPGDSLVSLYDTGELEIRAQVPGSRIGALERAQAGGLEVTGTARVDGEALQVRLDRLAGRSEAEQGGVEAIFAVAGTHSGVALGRFAEIDMALPPEPNTLVVPYKALYGRDRVYRVDAEQRLEPVAVRYLGEARRPDGSRGALIRAPGLEAGAPIVTTQIPQATDGLRVRIEGEG